MRGVGAGLSVWSPAMDSAVGQCQGPLCGGAAYPINDVEVIVGGCFRMDCRGEFKSNVSASSRPRIPCTVPHLPRPAQRPTV